MLFGDCIEGRVVSFLVADKGRVCFDDDFLFGAVGGDGSLLAPGVKLHH